MKVAATLLWEVFDCWRSWFLPAKLVQQIRFLDLSIPLSGLDVTRDVHALLDLIEGVAWDCVTPQNSSRTLPRQRPSVSPGRTHPAAGDFVWINPWSFSLCSAWEAQQSRRFGNQTLIPDTAPVVRVDPREPELCPAPSVPSSPLPTIPASSSPMPVRPSGPGAATPTASTVQLPSASPDIPASSTRAGSPIRLRSQVAPSSLSHTSPVRARTSAVSTGIPLPSFEHTESLSVREAPPSNAGSGSHSPSGADLPPNRGPSTPSSIPSKENNAVFSVYHSLLRAHGLESADLQGATMEDLRVIARQISSLPKEKTFGEDAH